MAPTPVRTARPGYRPYRVRVAKLARLSRHFTRVTFTGQELDCLAAHGLDQRLKMLLPLPGGGFGDIGADDDRVIADGTWYSRWRALPDSERNPIRTYTIRAVRPELREVDVDMVSHADGGPAMRWLQNAGIGDAVILVGPDARSIDSATGIDWHPGSANRLLLAGDETAAPAICAILESLTPEVSVQAFIELPDSADRLPVAIPDGCTLTWLPRDNTAAGTLLEPAVREWVAENRAVVDGALAALVQPVDDIDVDSELLWESPQESAEPGFYAWLAGEAGAIRSLRRFLVGEIGIDRSRVAFMGYWRAGKAEAQ